MFEVLSYIGIMMIVVGLGDFIFIRDNKHGLVLAVMGMIILIPAAVADTKLKNRQNSAFKLAKAGFINPIPTDSDDFGVTVPGISKRVRLLQRDGSFYVVDLSGIERPVKSPADVREIVGK